MKKKYANTNSQFPVETPPSSEEKELRIKPTIQNSMYDRDNKAAPDNNIFWEGGSNPLCSKGN